jgi:chromosomal replication initiation ATPase DnaA
MLDPVEEIVSACCREFGVKRSDVLSEHRGPPKHAWARHVAMFLCMYILDMNYAQVGRAFRRDPRGVKKAFVRVRDMTDAPDLDDFVHRVREDILKRLEDLAAAPV